MYIFQRKDELISEVVSQLSNSAFILGIVSADRRSGVSKRFDIILTLCVIVEVVMFNRQFS